MSDQESLDSMQDSEQDEPFGLAFGLAWLVIVAGGIFILGHLGQKQAERVEKENAIIWAALTAKHDTTTEVCGLVERFDTQPFQKVDGSAMDLPLYMAEVTFRNPETADGTPHIVKPMAYAGDFPGQVVVGRYYRFTIVQSAGSDIGTPFGVEEVTGCEKFSISGI